MDLTSEEFKEFYRKAFGVLDIDSDSFVKCFRCGAKLHETDSGNLICTNGHVYEFGEHLLEVSRMLKDYFDFTDTINYTSAEREEYPTDTMLIDGKLVMIDNKYLRI